MQKLSKKGVTIVIVACMILSVLFVTMVIGADPSVSSSVPVSGGYFANTNDGKGVQWTVNITDTDGNLAQVQLQGNTSGSWITFYDSGALGGVTWHNATGNNGNWTGSWTKYYWKIRTNDGTWHEITYNFTTEYQWGDIKPSYFSSQSDTYTVGGDMYKNGTGEYYMNFFNSTGAEKINVLNSTTGTNFSGTISANNLTIMSGSALDDMDGGAWEWFTYNNQPSFWYIKDGSTSTNWWIVHYNQSTGTWEEADSGRRGREYYASPSYCRMGMGVAIKYYDGTYQLVISEPDASSTPYIDLEWYTGTPYNTWSSQARLDRDTDSGSHDVVIDYCPNLEIIDGVLYLTYMDSGYDLHWQTYDGVSWTDKGDVELDVYHDGDNGYGGNAMVKDLLNDNLVWVYINASGDLCYRVLYNQTMWSDSHLIHSPVSGKSFKYPHLSFYDGRFAITLSYDLAGSVSPYFKLYSIFAPDYTEIYSGTNATTNRISFPNAQPNQQHVNSTAFSLKNIDSRNVTHIQWHFNDIGSITSASNIKIWTNMSGSWTNGWAGGADSTTDNIDISTVMAGGGEWETNTLTWWKIEILNIGSVVEDLHATDNSFWYKVKLE